MPQDFHQRMQSLLGEFDKADKAKVRQGGSVAVVVAENDSPGGTTLQNVGRGLLTNHFRNARDGGPAEHIEFKSGAVGADGRMLNGIVVRADPMDLPGSGQGYGGVVETYKNGRMSDSAVFSANIRPDGPGGM